MNLCLNGKISAQELEEQTKKYSTDRIRETPVEVRSTGDQKFGEKREKKEYPQKNKGWIWAVIGLLVVAGGAVALAGGGLDNSDGSGSDSGTGGAEIQW